MTQTKQQFSSFEEYLDYNDGTDKVYELFGGNSDGSIFSDPHLHV